VTRIHCELEPCDTPFGRCARLIAYLYRNVEVSCGFPCGPAEEDRDAGVDALRRALKEQGP
jgi:hypothetical protein